MLPLLILAVLVGRVVKWRTSFVFCKPPSTVKF